MLGFVLDRRRRHTGFDQLDPPAIHSAPDARRPHRPSNRLFPNVLSFRQLRPLTPQ
jgi:hypothetical protein